ncbi:MAG: rRNA methyltransferase [Micavibrio sp.]|nr:rRNA methyltransferase [Micavibrio sp.]|tara:strand:- start:7896 stop:8669 length:774 start_codon:yes stop_codon:yes gene_type:complete
MTDLSCTDTTPKPAIILVTPQMGENIGAAARAMANFGLTDLRLVAPRDGWPNHEALRNASGALDDLVQARVFDTLQQAINDLHTVLATTARPRDMVKDVYTPQSAATRITSEQTGAAIKTGLVFGGERAGLGNDDIARCHGIITIPTNPDFSSLNLGQSVLLVCWEWFRALDNTNDIQRPLGDSFPATQDKMDEFFVRLEHELEKGNFFKARDLKPTMLRNIRTMLTRAGFSDQELRTLHGIVSALIGKKKAAKDTP